MHFSALIVPALTLNQEDKHSMAISRNLRAKTLPLPDVCNAIALESDRCTACVHRIYHRKWKETKQLPSMLPGPAVPGCCLVSFYFLWAILCTQAVLYSYRPEGAARICMTCTQA